MKITAWLLILSGLAGSMFFGFYSADTIGNINSQVNRLICFVACSVSFLSGIITLMAVRIMEHFNAIPRNPAIAESENIEAELSKRQVVDEVRLQQILKGAKSKQSK